MLAQDFRISLRPDKFWLAALQQSVYFVSFCPN